MSKTLQRKKVWAQVATRSATYYDFDSLVDVIADLQELSKEYPGARINSYTDYDQIVMGIEIERDETDAELRKREREEASSLTRKRAQYETLKKELGEDK